MILKLYIEEHHATEQDLLRNLHHLFLKDFFTPPSIISLSEQEDNLPMWNTYGCNAKGVCIGFSLDKLKDSFNFNVDKCIYTSLEEENYFDSNYLDKIYNHLQTYRKCDNVIIPFGNIVTEFRKNFLTKNKDYEYEKEWRICCQSEEYDFIVKDDIIKPHINVEIPLSCIRSITLGPNIKNKEFSLDALRFFLETIIGKENASQIECKLSMRHYRDL